MPVLFAIGVAVFVVFIFVVVPRVTIAMMRGPLQARVRERYPDERAIVRAIYSATCVGLESLGRLQARGNGALVLTEAEVCFIQFIPRRTIVVPLQSLRDVLLVHRHLGKATPMKLLRLEFFADSGPDAVAFWLRDSAEMKALLDARRPAAPAQQA